ncbi:MAG: FAD-binding oxidoreductase [Dokdonella sp.]|uniref:FAD-binding oxidoreductase n=1 Tax=Dokdonella sp. TaxID=2291710 RepID=UPI003265E61D
MRGYALADVDLTSFDRQLTIRCRVQRPDRYRLIDALPTDAPRIARGSGVSYVGASFGGDAITQDLGAFDRLLGFDPQTGRLALEAGARIGDVQRFALAHGWYVAVSPGHPGATIGGCIAADVHGKNPARDGTFRSIVDAIEVSTPEGGSVVASASRHPELFAATFAGFGLTGTITRATMQLARPPASLVLRRIPVRNFVEAARVLREAANAPLLYGWHEGSPAHFGRGVIRVGLASDVTDARQDPLPSGTRDLPDSIQPWPFAVWNRSGIALANSWLRLRWCRAGQSSLPLASALFPLNDARFYFAAYGSAGLAEAQWLLPHVRFESFAEALAGLVARSKPRIAMIASKAFAGVAHGFSFDGDGIALAIQIPAPAEPSQRAFLESLAELGVGHGGRPNLIKDSTLDASIARRAIAGFEDVRSRLALHNDGGMHRSALSMRLGL